MTDYPNLTFVKVERVINLENFIETDLKKIGCFGGQTKFFLPLHI